jgi:hypothetical protein
MDSGSPSDLQTDVKQAFGGLTTENGTRTSPETNSLLFSIGVFRYIPVL